MNDYSDLLYLMGAMIVFSIYSSNVNANMVRSDTLLTDTEVELTAIGLGQSVIDEARDTFFDEVAVTADTSLIGQLGAGLLTPAQIPAAFTAPAGLGPETGEAYPNFDDFDDYDGLDLTRATAYGTYRVRAEVVYAPTNAPMTTSTNRTTLKRLTVRVTHADLPNEITLSFLQYHY